MKAKRFLILSLFVVVYTIVSCSFDVSEDQDARVSSLKFMDYNYNYNYNLSELETMALINTYRVSVG